MKQKAMKILVVWVFVLIFVPNILAQEVNPYDARQVIDSLLGTPDMSGFNWWRLGWGFLFSSIGLVAFVYGRKNGAWKPFAIGLVLMLYPYVIPNTMFTFIIGVVLTASLYFFRE